MSPTSVASFGSATAFSKPTCSVVAALIAWIEALTLVSISTAPASLAISTSLKTRSIDFAGMNFSGSVVCFWPLRS